MIIFFCCEKFTIIHEDEQFQYYHKMFDLNGTENAQSKY